MIKRRYVAAMPAVVAFVLQFSPLTIDAVALKALWKCFNFLNIEKSTRIRAANARKVRRRRDI